MRGLLAVVLVCWCLFLALHWGDPFDETEHAHVAWLMAHGHRPIHDFFQHHQPLLWDVLRLYFLIGDGPEVLYAGRGLVVACAVVSWWALSRGSPKAHGTLAILPLLISTVLIPTLWVLRPETLGAALMFVAVALWRRTDGEPEWRGILFEILAGVLFAAALFSSPRFLLLGVAFVCFGVRWDRTLPWRLTTMATGVVLFVSGYVLLKPSTPSDVWFNIESSRAIAQTGPGYFKELPLQLTTMACFVALGIWTATLLEKKDRRAFVLRGGVGVLIFAASLASGWPYLYAQNLAAGVVWMALMLADAERRIDWSRQASRLRVVGLLTVVAALTCVGLLFVDVQRGQTIAIRVQTRRALLEKLQLGDKVLLSSATHPICVEDVSFYGHPLVDAEERLPLAMMKLRDRWPLPECDFLKDAQRKPAVIDGFTLGNLSEKRQRELKEILDKEYQQQALPTKDGQLLGETLYFRKR
jgi:hypothetical protein